MDYTMTKPCADCPFTKGNVIELTAARAKEITDNMLSWGGGEFPCHKLLSYCGEEKRRCRGVCEGHETDKSQFCAGALIFAEKHQFANQMMRIAGRIGMYDPSKLMSDENKEAKDRVFDTKSQMLAHFKKRKRRITNVLSR